LIQDFALSSSGSSIVGKKTMKTTTRPIPNLAGLPSDERMQLEDQIMERALALWHKKGHAHRNALNALLQAEREIMAQKRTGKVHSWLEA
jgi:hypothetical protein